MDKVQVIDKLKKYRILLDAHLDIKQMYLFGSYASGKQHPYSDIDVAIVVKNLNDDFFEINPLLWRLRRDIDIRIEPVLIEENSDLTGFLEMLKKTGIEIV